MLGYLDWCWNLNPIPYFRQHYLLPVSHLLSRGRNANLSKGVPVLLTAVAPNAEHEAAVPRLNAHFVAFSPRCL